MVVHTSVIPAPWHLKQGDQELEASLGYLRQIIQRDPQSNIEWSSGTLIEELGEGLRALKCMRTPQKDQLSQLAWTLGVLRD